ncbi:MAG: glycine--tRNA ligase subunit beta [Thiohalocapsa sp.]|jgi:glycyl-tRNA synthetase beta chain|uniref:glycine--tRNA ligase subunit beta n=1 Tax=Thiohalocapsa sp. TaxID=2497641 RepID=UPI0025E65CD0|nr:glycine--tRNA ligase subunit beta [Thiohalocapsa sp.]MCG6941225.1 glycine--tRNA ligase subunit beta [Thiohalocapsa sp.]
MERAQDLLIEIGTEELPPTALLRLSESFTEEVRRQFDAHGLTHGSIESFATPRRLSLLVRELATRQPDREDVRRGPAVKAAFDAEGQPTKAALGFAKSCGVEVSELAREETDKGAWLVHRRAETGQATQDLLPELAANALGKLPIPKRMRWGAGEVSFVRPVQWVCAVFGDKAVPGTLMGVEIGNQTYGHRFHHPQPITIETPTDYAASLRRAHVEPEFAARRESIYEQVKALAASVDGEASMPSDLLDEVTALCEWPVAVLGHFDEAFLEVPAEVLIETMQQHQKYFSLVGKNGMLLPYFVAVSNIESRSPDVVRAGNERVIRPRFSDARFFWEQDLRVPLGERRETLERVVFQHKLGSVAEKSRRVASVARQIAEMLGYDASLVERAAQIAKCDLVTAMVGEFAVLQGTMGRYYASRSGEDPCVVAAMEEQYLPRQAGDRLPDTECGRVLALADRLDTLVGIFAIGERPTGVKDPYGLRRAAIGVLRILIETPLALDLRGLLNDAAAAFPAEIQASLAVPDAYAYIMERLRGYYAEQGVGADAIEAVMAVDASVPSDFDKRVRAVTDFAGLEAASALSAANKRIANILKKSDVEAGHVAVAQDLLSEPAERALADQVEALRERITPMLKLGDYSAALTALAELRADVDRFFDDVMVMAEDSSLRANRVALVQAVGELFSSIADISRLRVGEQP